MPNFSRSSCKCRSSAILAVIGEPRDDLDSGVSVSAALHEFSHRHKYIGTNRLESAFRLR